MIGTEENCFFYQIILLETNIKTTLKTDRKNENYMFHKDHSNIKIPNLILI